MASIGRGILVLLGVETGDSEAEAMWLVQKIARMRIFPSEAKPMDRSVADVSGAVLVVSQFTILADHSKGNRPRFHLAAPPEIAEELVSLFADEMRSHVPDTQTGVFGADMKVELLNDGPVTFHLNRGPAP